MARPTKELEALAANVRQLREERGLTQAELAEGAGLATRYVQTLESPAANPRAAVLVALAHALRVDVGRLFRPATLRDRPAGRPPRAGGRAQPRRR